MTRARFVALAREQGYSGALHVWLCGWACRLGHGPRHMGLRHRAVLAALGPVSWACRRLAARAAHLRRSEHSRRARLVCREGVR